MNPWRKRRRQKLRRQMIASLPTIEQLMAGLRADFFAFCDPPIFSRQINADGTEESDAEFLARYTREFPIDFTKPMPRLFIAHDPSEFFGLEDL